MRAAIDDWLLRELVSYLDEDDVYWFWIFAEDHSLGCVRDSITSVHGEGVLSQARALYLAMGYSYWTAVHTLTKPPLYPRLSRRSYNHIVDEIQRRVAPPQRPHPSREKAMMVAAEAGSVPNFVMYFAVQQGNLESVIWLHSVAWYDPPEALRIAARHGHDHVISWLLDNAPTAQWILEDCSVEWAFRYEDDPELGILAWRVTYEGKSHVSVFSREWGFADTDLWGTAELRAVDLPVKYGDLEAVKRLLSHDVFGDNQPRLTATLAARAGHLHVVQWCYEHHAEIFEDSDVLVQAAEHGQLEVARWAATHVKDRDGVRRAYYDVVLKGHELVLRWLAETFPEITKVHVNTQYLGIACEGGHLPIVQWFVKERGINVRREHLGQVASRGHIKVFQWLLDIYRQDREWDESWLDDAAECGDPTFVRHLVEDCGLWSPSACAAATNCEVAEYLHSFASLHGKTLHGLHRGRSGKPMLRDGLFETLTWQLTHGLFGGRFEKKMFDKINDFETNFAKKQQQLGWTDYGPVGHEYWPRNPSNMKRLRKVVQVVIDMHDMAFLLQVTWLPKWAVQHGTIKNLERLAEIGHPKLLSTKIFRMLLRVSRDADKVQWFLIKEPSLFSTNVVRWAVQYDKRHLLSWIFREVLATTDSDFEVLKFRCVKTAQWFARKYGRREIHAWVLTPSPSRSS